MSPPVCNVERERPSSSMNSGNVGPSIDTGYTSKATEKRKQPSSNMYSDNVDPSTDTGNASEPEIKFWEVKRFEQTNFDFIDVENYEPVCKKNSGATNNGNNEHINIETNVATEKEIAVDANTETVNGKSVDPELVDTETFDTETVDTENADTEMVDTENADAETVDTETVDTENGDAEMVDAEKDTKKVDAENGETKTVEVVSNENEIITEETDNFIGDVKPKLTSLHDIIVISSDEE